MAPFPHQAGAASALLGTLQFAVGAATGAVVGVFHDGAGLPMALTIAGCGAALAGDHRSPSERGESLATAASVPA